jgi:hypothetical protein
LQDLGVTILSVILRRIILGSNCTALSLEVGARPSHVDHGGSVLNCYQFELARLIVLNLKICLNIGFLTPFNFGNQGVMRISDDVRFPFFSLV